MVYLIVNLTLWRSVALLCLKIQLMTSIICVQLEVVSYYYELKSLHLNLSANLLLFWVKFNYCGHIFFYNFIVMYVHTMTAFWWNNCNRNRLILSKSYVRLLRWHSRAKMKNDFWVEYINHIHAHMPPTSVRSAKPSLHYIMYGHDNHYKSKCIICGKSNPISVHSIITFWLCLTCSLSF